MYGSLVNMEMIIGVLKLMIKRMSLEVLVLVVWMVLWFVDFIIVVCGFYLFILRVDCFGLFKVFLS